MPDRHHLKMVEAHDCEDFSIEDRATAREPYHYVESGLDNWFLIGVRYWTCELCGKQYAEIPAIHALHRLIARTIACQQSPLRGEDMRFLRKRLGKNSTEFAAILGVTLETYSRFENGRQKPSKTYDHLVRFYYALHSDDRELCEHARTVLDEAITASTHVKKPPKISATIQGNKWHSESRAA